MGDNLEGVDMYGNPYQEQKGRRQKLNRVKFMTQFVARKDYEEDTAQTVEKGSI